jgi:hypothetical protein
MLGVSSIIMGIVWVVGVCAILAVIAKLMVPRKKT